MAEKQQSSKKQPASTPEPNEGRQDKGSPDTVKPVRAVEVIPSDRQRALEAIRPSDSSENSISLPRIVVLQSKSREVERDEDPLPVGQFYNRLTKEIIGEGFKPGEKGKQFEFIPLMYFPQRIRIELGAGLRCRSINMRTAQMMGGLTVANEPTDNCGLCKLKEWPRDRIARGETIPEDKARRGPECSVTENFPSLLTTGFDTPDDYELILLSFQRTSLQAAKDLRGNYSISGKDWWTSKYKLVVVKDSGGPNNSAYYKQEVRRSGKPSPEEILRAEKMLKFLAGRDITVEGPGEDEELARSAAADPAAAKEAAF